MGGIKAMKEESNLSEAQASFIKGVVTHFNEIKLESIVDIINLFNGPDNQVTAKDVTNVRKSFLFKHVDVMCMRTTSKWLAEHIMRKAGIQNPLPVLRQFYSGRDFDKL